MHLEDRDENWFQVASRAVKGWAKLLLLLIGFLCFLAGSWWLYCLKENQLGRQAWARVKAELEAQGENLDWDSIVREPIPDELNFAKAPIIQSITVRKGATADLADWLDYDDRYIHRHVGDSNSQNGSDFAAMVRDIEVNAEQPVEWLSSNSAQRIREWAGFDPAIEQELIVAAKLSDTRFIPERFDGSVPNYVNFRTLAQRVAVLASADLASDNPQRALDLTRVNLALSRGFHDSHSRLVGTMIGVAIDSTSLSVIWEGLVDHRWEEHQLVEIDVELRRRDLIALIQDAMRCERLELDGLYADTKSVYNFYNQAQLIGGRSAKLDTATFASNFMPDGWAYRSRAAYSKLIQDTVIAFYDRETRIGTPSIVSTADAEIRRMKSSNHPRDRFVRMTIPNFTKAYIVSARTQVQIDHTRIAIAVERYRTKKNSLPDSLEDLVPEFIEVLPHDRIGGESYSYRPLTEGEFMLWGIGWNELDENGALATRIEKGDWVWLSFAKELPEGIVTAEAPTID